ncbi:MAG TPA: hypothetical protein VLR26_12880 [Frankiaceae bacterium]|nr:hypothetical protein [Frankiaceae bacterium]
MREHSPDVARADSAHVARLTVDLQQLYGSVLRWSQSRWSSQASDGRSRADVGYALILDLAVLGARAGSGAPPSLRPPRLGDHVLADQLLVLGSELVAAPRADDVAADAAAAVRATRRLLLG